MKLETIILKDRLKCSEFVLIAGCYPVCTHLHCHWLFTLFEKVNKVKFGGAELFAVFLNGSYFYSLI